MMNKIVIFISLSLLAGATQEFRAFATKYVGGTDDNCGASLKEPDYPFVAVNKGGVYNGGKNCGRWLRVRFGEACVNGYQNYNTPCTGQLVQDDLSGKTIDVQVRDSCGDFGWCTEDEYHLDMTVQSIKQLGGQAALDNWNNPIIYWQWIDAPNYQGDITIWFGYGGNPWWPKLVFSNLLRGVSRIQRKIGS